MSIEKGLWEADTVPGSPGFDSAAFARVPDLRHAGDWGVGVTIVVVLAAPILCLGDVRYFEENALIELTQCALAWTAGVLFMVAAMRAPDRLSVLSLLWLSLFSLTLLVREIEFDGTRFEPWLSRAMDMDLDYAFLGIVMIALFLLSLGYVRAMARATIAWMWKGAGRLLISGTVFYLLGDVGEKGLLSDDDAFNRIFEESFELLGTLCLFVCAHATLRRRAAFSPATARQTP
ncbi:MAG: hypothetical protein RIE84_10550 [Parvibaculum sp.]|uniref:hypothetical protein n=1 Tax=Parvibaculum sp. TaxID=2024848 RepID=UPI0032EB26B9